MSEGPDTSTVMGAFLEAEHGGELDDYFKPKIGEFHASTTGSCPRRMYYDFVEPKRPGKGAWKHFELGNRMEDVFEDALAEKHGSKYVINRVPIDIDFGQYKIVGETDPVVINDNMEIDTLWEVKSTTNLSYVRNKPKWPHVTQLHAYAYGLDLMNRPGARKIVYIDKTSLETVTHEVSFEQGIWKHVTNKLETVYEALMNGEPPEVSEDKHRDHFCPHKEEPYCCHNEPAEEPDPIISEEDTEDTDDSDSNDGWGL